MLYKVALSLESMHLLSVFNIHLNMVLAIFKRLFLILLKGFSQKDR